MDQILYDYVMSHNGLPYIWGGDDSIEGMDCSGLVIEYLQSCGLFPVDRDTTAQGLLNYFSGARSMIVDRPRFGSLVFYGKSRSRITHVAFGLDRYRIQEAGGGGRTTLTREDAIAQNAYVRIRPFDHRSDLITILHPYYQTVVPE